MLGIAAVFRYPMGSTSLDHVVDFISDIASKIFLLKQAILIIENVSGQWAIRFPQCFRIDG